MSDLHVVAVLRAKSGSEDAVGTALRDLVPPTRAEDGCLAYELFESTATPGTFITVEAWRSQADLDAHLLTPHIGQALASAGEHLDGDPAIHPLRPMS